MTCGLRNPRAGRPGTAGNCADRSLLILAIVTCAVTRLIALEGFPIYFLSDEAASTVLAAEFLQNGWRDSSGELFPTYFANTEKLSLSLSVYAQLVPVVLFGRSVVVARAWAALLAVSGAVAAGLILRDRFGLRRAWLGVLFLTITPAWFLHSRTAFETSLAVSMYTWCLYAYLRYRCESPKALPMAVFFAALAFYAYNAIQAGLLLTGLLLLTADARYHLRHRGMVGAGLALAVLLALPYLRFQLEHPGEVRRRLELVDSYLVREDLPTLEKAVRLAKEYARGLGPSYWYAPSNQVDLIRHRMKGYGNILLPTLPLALVGLALSLRRWRHPAYRLALIAALSAPVGAALAGIQVTRILVFVVPAALFTAVGASALLDWVARRWGDMRMSTAVFMLLAAFAGWMLRDALVNGPTWYSNYGLTGLQYGSRQVFGEAVAYLEQHPDRQVWLFPTWLNGPDMLRRFFAPDETNLQLRDLVGFLAERSDGIGEALLILTRDDYRRVIESGKFSEVIIEKELPLPDGTIGFVLARMTYSLEAQALFAGERLARERMGTAVLVVNGRPVSVRYSPLQAGSAANLFDGDPETMVLTAGANPLRIELEFQEVVRITGLSVLADMADLGLTFEGFGSGLQPAFYEAEFRDQSSGWALDMAFDPPPGLLSRVVIQIKEVSAPATASVSLRELVLREE